MSGGGLPVQRIPYMPPPPQKKLPKKVGCPLDSVGDFVARCAQGRLPARDDDTEAGRSPMAKGSKGKGGKGKKGC